MLMSSGPSCVVAPKNVCIVRCASGVTKMRLRAVGKPPEISLQLFSMACFEQDRFRRFVLSESFRNSYDLDDSLFRELETDDIALMKFGFRFLRQVLFAERSIPERAGAWEERYERRKEVFELRRQVEIARARQLEDEKYSEGL